VIAATLLLATAAAAPPAELEFRFRPAAARAPEGGVPLEITTPGEAVRADLLVDDGNGAPRWRWMDGGALERGRIRLRAPVDALALVVFRRPSGARGYELEGPFRWPAIPGSRIMRPLPRRTLRGNHRLASGADVRLLGAPPADPLCESDLDGRWQCVAVPPDFSGRVVACDGGSARVTAAIRRGSTGDVAMHELVTSALVRVASEPARERVAVSVRLLRPIASGSVVLSRDPSSLVEALEDGLFWLESRGDSADAVVEFSAAGFATSRLPLVELRSACGLSAPVELRRAAPLAGTVHELSDRPVAGATVLVRSADPDRGGDVLADTVSDESGGFEVPDLEPTRYRVRACHARFGCGDAVTTPGKPVQIALDCGAAFVGRVLTAAGVPEPAAHVRIVPSVELSAGAGDRLERLPLETASGSDGRFRVSAPGPGDFLLEVRSASSGVARLPVRRSALTPAVTDLGDVRLPEPLELAVRVVRCGGGVLSMSGPLGGETSLPSFARFPLDPDGTAVVRLPEGGVWTAWATCGSSNVVLEPAVLPDLAALATAGIEVRFEPVGALGDQLSERSK
jgi:Carboxypeptidase regulatory-like domain